MASFARIPLESSARRGRAPRSERPADGTSSASFHVGPLRFTIRCPFPDLAQDVLTLYSGADAPAPAGRGEPGALEEFDYLVQEEAPGADRPPTYQVVRNGETLYQGYARDALLSCLEWEINDRSRRSLSGYHLFHAGAVARNGHGILLPGPSGSGKSTTVAALALHGFEYCSDELAVVGSDGRLRPFPRIVCLKPGGWRTIHECLPAPVSAARWPSARAWGVWYGKPPALPDAAQARSGYPVDFILIPRHDPHQATALRPVPRSQAVKELVEQSMNLQLWGAAGLDLLTRLTRRADCYSLTINDLAEAVALIEDLTR